MTIKRKGSRYQLFTKSGARPLGPPTTKAKTLAQERAIEASKHARDSRTDERDDMSARRALRRKIMDTLAKRRPRPIARPAPPNGLTLRMTRLLVGASRAMDAAITAALRREGIVRTDAAADGGGPTMPDLTAADRKRLMGALRRRLRSIASQKALVGGLDALANSAIDFTRTQWRQQLQRAIGIDLTADPDLAPLVERFRRANVDRIVALADEKVDRVERVLREAGPGTRVEQIQQRIAEQTGATESHAALIARTEVTSLNAKMSQARHEAAGIKEFTWSTSKDERVRDSHRVLEGRRFAYSDLPIVDGQPTLPGAIYNCRCVAVPFIPGFDE